MSSIGILGGSFDPFHNGHLHIAKSAMEKFNLSKIIILPAKTQPFKVGRKMASEQDRLNITRLVSSQNMNFFVSTVELEGEGLSYTFKTLEILKEEYPDDKLYFIMGTDSFLSLDSWYKGEELIEKYSFIIATRPGFKENEVKETLERYKDKYNSDIEIMDNDVVDVSSTQIKQALKAGKTIIDFVPPEVERYIKEHGLYR